MKKLIFILLILLPLVLSADPSLKEKLSIKLNDLGIPSDIVVALISALPIFELRGGIPIGILTLDLPWWRTFIAAVIGNMIPVPFIIIFIGPVSRWLSKWSIFKKFFDWWFARTKKRSKKIEKYRTLGIMLFVAIPLPITGAWTGSLAAFLAGVQIFHALWAVFLGVICAAIIVTITTLLLSKIGIFGALLLAVLILFVFSFSFFKILGRDESRISSNGRNN